MVVELERIEKVPKLSCTMNDAYGRTTNRVYGMESQTLLADYVVAYTAFLAALEPTTDLGLAKCDLIIPVTGLGWVPIALANKDTGGTASGWIDSDLGKKASMRIPGVKLSLVSADGTIPITGVIATFLALFETAGDFTLSDGETIESWIRATLDK